MQILTQSINFVFQIVWRLTLLSAPDKVVKTLIEMHDLMMYYFPATI